MNLVLPPIVLHWSFQLCPLTLAERCLCNEAACRNLVGAAVVAFDAIIVDIPLSRSSAASMERTRGSGEKSTSEEEEDDVVEEEELEDLRRCPLRPRGLGGRW